MSCARARKRARVRACASTKACTLIFSKWLLCVWGGMCVSFPLSLTAASISLMDLQEYIMGRRLP